ncbi:MAG: hypothetical protein KGJ11_10040, partial [Candidatus Omnitrophica bacterium]|nr:hypothetical protein [Candidatus Omnitrophota bacterium]
DSSMNVEAIYQRYLQAFKKGVFNYIKEETDPLTQATIPRKYFSGGFEFVNLPARLQIEDTQAPPDTSKFIGVVADMAMAPPAADTLLAEDTLKARVAQLEDEIGYWKGSVINLSEDAGQDKKQLQRIWNFVDEGRIIKVNLNQFEESGRPKRETYELLSRRLFALAFSLAQAGKYNEPNVMISIFLLLEEAFTRGNHFNMELPIYVRLEAQGVKVFEVDLGALNQQPDEEDVEAARGVMARREMGDVLPSQFFHKAEKALMWNSQPVGRMISIGFQDFAMQAASPPQELLQKILTSDAEDPQAPLLIENINQRHWKLQSDASGKISISPAPRHNIRFASLLPNMVYRASFSLSQDKKVRVTFSKGNTQVAYQIDNYRYDPQAGTQQIFMGHKVVPENARDAMSAVLGPELKPSPEQISVFNQREWVVESSKSGMFSFSPAAYHVVLFAHLFPNTDYTVRLGLSAEGRVRVNFSNNQKKLTYQINDYAYDLGRRTQKIFIANKLKSMTMIGGLSPGQSQLMRQVVDGLERIDNSVTKEILQMRQMMTLPQAQQIARQRIYLEGLAGQGPFDSRVLLNNAITVRLNIFTVALKQGPQFNWEKNRPFILSLSQELFAA